MKSSLRRGTTSGLVLLLVLNAIAMVPTATSAASAPEPIVMLVPNIPGSSTLPGHAGWIDVTSFAGSAVAPATPGGAGPPCHMVVQKPLDIASPHLWVATVTGQLFTTIEIQLMKPSTTGSLVVLYDIKLENAEFTSIGDSDSNALPLESVTIKATRVILTFNTQNPNGTINPITTSFTCA
jgi:type VI secretion system Hcp family effector